MGIADNFWKWLGVQTDVEEEYIELPAVEGSVQDSKHSYESRNNRNVVSIHTNKNMRVVVCEPERFDEVQALADHLKNRRQIILNFESTPPEISQRIIDFVSGTVYALDGQSQQLGKNIFLFAPSNIEITKDHRALMRKPTNIPDPFGGEG